MQVNILKIYLTRKHLGSGTKYIISPQIKICKAWLKCYQNCHQSAGQESLKASFKKCDLQSNKQ